MTRGNSSWMREELLHLLYVSACDDRMTLAGFVMLSTIG
ncbi:MAG: hypothetical protein RL063_946 [Pseudomonadota bacterium]|jgi:hypothetical protein